MQQLVQKKEFQAFMTSIKGETALLTLLKFLDHPNATTLSKIFGVSKPRITCLMHGFLRKGYVQKFVDESDNRQQFLRLTPKGMALVDQTQSENRVFHQKVLEHLGSEKADQLLSIVQDIIQILD